ncbi:MAG: sulfotransferase [Myxococcota bacterium]|nr:sulfotransferase [Myxococcota bacterium]
MPALDRRGMPPHAVLVAGAGRSGTTWLGKLLDADPWVLYRHEPDNVERLDWFREVPSRLEPDDAAPTAREAFRRGLWRCLDRHALHFVRPPRFPKAFLRPAPFALLEQGLRAAGRLVRDHSPEVPIPGPVWRGDRDRIHLVLKSVISNLRLAWLRRQFPTLRVVLIVRHPGGYLSSWLRGVAREGWRGFGNRDRLDPVVLPLRRPEHEALRPLYEKGTPFERELVYWIVANETPLLELAEDPDCRTVVYERLCEDPQGELAAVYRHCGLEPGAATRGFVEASTSRHDDAYHAVFKDPSHVAWAWRRHLDDAQVRTVESALARTSLAPLWSTL